MDCDLYGVVHGHVIFNESNLRKSVNNQRVLSAKFKLDIAHLIDIGSSLLYRKCGLPALGQEGLLIVLN